MIDITQQCYSVLTLLLIQYTIILILCIKMALYWILYSSPNWCRNESYECATQPPHPLMFNSGRSLFRVHFFSTRAYIVVFCGPADCLAGPLLLAVSPLFLFRSLLISAANIWQKFIPMNSAGRDNPFHLLRPAQHRRDYWRFSSHISNVNIFSHVFY